MNFFYTPLLINLPWTYLGQLFLILQIYRTHLVQRANFSASKPHGISKICFSTLHTGRNILEEDASHLHPPKYASST